MKAIAILLAVVFHPFPRFSPGGFIGVDVSFVNTGYLITLAIAQEMRNGTFTLK